MEQRCLATSVRRSGIVVWPQWPLLVSEKFVFQFRILTACQFFQLPGEVEFFHDGIAPLAPSNQVDFFTTATAKGGVITGRIGGRSDCLLADWAFWQADQDR